MTVAASLPLKADEATCRSVLHSCDTAVHDLQKENAIQKQLIQDEEERFSTQSKELRSEEFWKPVAIGAVGAALLEGLILSFKK